VPACATQPPAVTLHDGFHLSSVTVNRHLAQTSELRALVLVLALSPSLDDKELH
jgi:hypothetical protein